MTVPFRKTPSPRLLCCLVATLIVFALVVSLPVSAAVSGAIFTTTADGQTVNGNIYINQDVYLNGGPQNMQSAGLVPDGTYYFQVTDPSGQTLLSTDDISCRELTVLNGVVTGSTGGCPHANGAYNPANGSTTVDLLPFLTTPNAGGEYKAWLTPVASYDAANAALQCPSGGECWGFVDSASKTDNFKYFCTDPITCGTPTPPPPQITGYKWYDANTNGVYDSGESYIPGWRINAEDDSTFATFFTYTDSTGLYTFPVDASNQYTISEVLPNSAWIETGCVSHLGQAGGASATYTSSKSPSAIVETGTNNNVLGPDFGNVCTGGGGGLTIGYWSNKNGQAEWVPIPFGTQNGGNLNITATQGPNLVGPSGKNWIYEDFSSASSYSAFRTWLLNATATNMAYMLSAQMAGMWENIFGLTTGSNGTRTAVDPSALIFTGPVAGTAPSGCTKLTPNAAGFATIQNVLNAASCAVGASTGENTTKAGTIRNYEQWLKNALDAANNNNSFVQPGPDSCPFTTPY